MVVTGKERKPCFHGWYVCCSSLMAIPEHFIHWWNMFSNTIITNKWWQFWITKVPLRQYWSSFFFTPELKNWTSQLHSLSHLACIAQSWNGTPDWEKRISYFKFELMLYCFTFKISRKKSGIYSSSTILAFGVRSRRNFEKDNLNHIQMHYTYTCIYWDIQDKPCHENYVETCFTFKTSAFKTAQFAI